LPVFDVGHPDPLWMAWVDARVKAHDGDADVVVLQYLSMLLNLFSLSLQCPYGVAITPENTR